MAWTSVGGEIMFIEASRMQGTGELILTGQLGDVMKESAQIALNWVRSTSQKVSCLSILSTSVFCLINSAMCLTVCSMVGRVKAWT